MFFQNVLNQDFYGNWILGERTYSLSFKVPASRNGNAAAHSWNVGPYDLNTVADRTLTINYAIDSNFKQWAALAINVAGATPAATTTHEIVAILNANATFADRFIASAELHNTSNPNSGFRLVIKTKVSNTPIRFYVSNTGAETKLQINRYAGIAEMPVYFDRHTFANRFAFTDGHNHLIALSHPITNATVANPTVVTSVNHGLTTGDVILIVNSNSSPTIDGSRTVTVTGNDTFTVPVNVTTAGNDGAWMSAYEQTMITNAGFTPANLLEDWELLAGRSVLFNFRKNVIDGSNRITQIIEYQAGARAGDLAMKTQYTYTGANTNPDQVTEVPYVLLSGDLVTPP